MNNGIPMKFNYSKTINEQLNTFNYYKSRYASYELQILKSNKEKQDLIKWLEDKIKEEYDYDDDFGNIAFGKSLLQEVLDKVRGDKDEVRR